MIEQKVEYCECERCGRIVICSECYGEMLCDKCEVEAKAERK